MIPTTCAAPGAARFLSPSPSPLPEVSAEAWQRFCTALEVQKPGAISPSGGYGAYDLRPARLVELGYAERGPQVRRGARFVQTCTFLPPWTEEKFLGSYLAQLAALRQSMKRYGEDLARGKIERPQGMSLAGALSILHRGGRGALKGWPEIFSDTRQLYEQAKGMF